MFLLISIFSIGLCRMGFAVSDGNGINRIDDENLELRSSAASAAELKLFEPSSGSDYSAFKVADQSGSNITYTLPTVAPATNQVLTAGTPATNLTWAAAATAAEMAQESPSGDVPAFHEA